MGPHENVLLCAVCIFPFGRNEEGAQGGRVKAFFYAWFFARFGGR